MKNLILFLTYWLILYPAAAQNNPVPQYKVVPLITKETFTLNSGGRALIGGRSRNYLLVQLPPHTIEWYYAVTTSPEKTPEPTIGLAEQLIKYLTPTGMAASVMSALLTPSGSGACDVYLFADQNDLNIFLSKTGQAQYLMSGSRQNFNQGAVQIHDALEGNYFLGMRNPSGLAAIRITIEVCAIVRE